MILFISVVIKLFQKNNQLVDFSVIKIVVTDASWENY